MSNSKIFEYLATLTPEQIQKLVDNLPRLYAAIKEDAANG